jgi:4-hydroxybenzoate polyprenyltransferase
MPFVVGWNAVSPSLSLPMSLGLTFLFAQAGGHTLHIASDREADSLAGLNTSAVRFGGRVVSRLGFVFFLFSLMLHLDNSTQLIVQLVLLLVLLLLFIILHLHSTFMGAVVTRLMKSLGVGR